MSSHRFWLLFLPLTLLFALSACEDARDSGQRESPESPAAQADSALDAKALIREAIAAQGQFAKRGRILADLHALVEASDNAVRVDSDDDIKKINGKLEPGDTLGELLERFDEDSARAYVSAVARVFPIRSFRAGNPYVVCTDAGGRLCRFEYEVNDKHRLVVEGDDCPIARLEKLPYITRLATCQGVIDENLFDAVTDMGEGPQLAYKLVDLFGSEINFLRHIRQGDSFAILLEKRFLNGEYKGYGRILAAAFTNRGKTYEAWLFPDGDGKFNYYNSKGENLKKALLISPLAITRVTSTFSHARKHPILGGLRPHLGVDYAAPKGTPVKAVGDGVVTQRAWAGGYGNQIIIRHNGNLESMYAHLSGYARGLDHGQRVRQGQVIGFVGSTGLSTGPHLDFRLRHNDKYINPAKAINPREEPVHPSLMPHFKKAVALSREYLNGRPLPTQYTLDSIVPSRVSSGAGSGIKSAKSEQNKITGSKIHKRSPRAKFTRNRVPVRMKVALERRKSKRR